MRSTRYRSGGASGGGGSVAWGPDFGEGVHQLDAQVLNLVAAGDSSANPYLAGKDTWVDLVALCPVDVAREGSDLELDGVVATRKDVWAAWNLASLPAGASVSAATLAVNVKTPPGTGGDVTLNHIPNGSETWDEATWRCSVADDVALTAFQTWTSPFGTAGEKSVALNATATARIAARMGAGFYTVVFTAATLHTNAVLESADEGTANSLGPRLGLTWTRTVEA